jgi:flagellar hook assembly protein FlgD
VSFTLDLPGEATVSVAVLDVLGRRIWSAPERAYEAGRWTIGWDGRTSAGAEAPAGIYSARVVVGERVMVRRIARLR